MLLDRLSRIQTILAAAVVVGGLASFANAAVPFTPGDLIVSRFDNGGAALTSAATTTFIDEYTPTGTLVQTIALPTSVSGSNLTLTNSGTATSEGFLQASPDGSVVTIVGYNAAPGTLSITTSLDSNVNRVVGIIDATGAINTSTALNNAASTGNPRSVISDGNKVWIANGAGGVQTITAGTVGAGTQLSTTVANTRVVGLSGGQLYVSSASGAFQGVATIGTGEPTTSGQTTTILPGFPTTAGPSNYDYVFTDPTDLFVADDRATATAGVPNGGIEKWTLSGGTWTLQYTMSPSVTATTDVGLRGLTGSVTAGGVLLYATGTDSKLYSFLDTGATQTFTALATAPTNDAFRGVEFVPTAAPEPASLGVLALSGVALLARRRK